MRFVVVGCGRMGSGLVRALALRGHDVAAVDRDVAAFERLGPAFTGVKVEGVGLDRDVLLAAGVERADGLAALAGADEANVVVARVASLVFRVPRVVARVYDPAKAEVYRRLGLQTLAPVTWGIERTADLLTYSVLHATAGLGTGEVEIVEVDAPRLLAGRTAASITIPGQTLLVAVTRHGTTLLADQTTNLEAGDVLHVAVVRGALERLRSLLEVT